MTPLALDKLNINAVIKILLLLCGLILKPFSKKTLEIFKLLLKTFGVNLKEIDL